MADTVLGTGKMAFKKKKKNPSSGSLHRGERKQINKHIMSDHDECYE